MRIIIIYVQVPLWTIDEINGVKMLIPIECLDKVWRVHPKSILHVGAHLGEESDSYIKMGWGSEDPTVWIEAQHELAETLRNKLSNKDDVVLEAVAWNQSDIELEFNIANNTQSSSIFKLGTHGVDYPEIEFTEKVKVKTIRLDELLPKEFKFDFINLDIQGAELQALKGLGNKLNSVDWIYSEVNAKEVYEGCSRIEDLDQYLLSKDFKRVCTKWAGSAGWGDALYINTRNVKLRWLTARALTTFSWIFLSRVIRKLKRMSKVFSH